MIVIGYGAQGSAAMQSFIHAKNLEKYRSLLATTVDGREREVLLKLLAEEEAKEPPPKPRDTRPDF